MVLCGIGDEAGAGIDAQIKATLALGWRHVEMRAVEVPGYAKENIHDIADAAFDVAAGRLDEAGLQVYCFGSAIANWSKKIGDPFSETMAEAKRCVARMQRLNTRFVRIMSYKPGDAEDEIPAEVFRRVREITKVFLDAGLQPVHENCMNYGGMSWRHALRLLEACPGLKWVFDTGNPVFNADRSGPKPWPRQDAWEFWEHVRDHVVHFHIKDGVYVPEKNDCDYTWPGEGQGRLRDILLDALRRGYDGGFSIEPHLAAVFHDATSKADAGKAFDTFVNYGRRLEGMLRDVQAEVPAACL
jgi:sugar phosphate isomerase/epimerase